jgi:Fe-S cluster biogenesis protein NfuA
MAWSDAQAREHVARLDGLLEALDPGALEAVSGLVELYGEGLRRVVTALAPDAVEGLAGDELVGHLLMIHDLSPRSLHERVTAALDEVRPYLAQHGGGVELVGVEDATVRLSLEGHCHGCPSSTATLRSAVEEAIRAAAPEVERIEADGAVEPAGAVLPVAFAGGCPLPMADGAVGR